MEDKGDKIMKNILYNPIFKEYKSPVGAIKNSDEILITIKITKEYIIHQLRLVVKDDDNKITKTFEVNKINHDSLYNFYSVKFTINEVGLYWYYFEFDDIYGTHFISSSNSLDAMLTDYSPLAWQLSIHDDFINELNWYQGKVMYQIMVDRFYNYQQTSLRSDIIFHNNWNEMPMHKFPSGEVLNNDFFGGNIPGIIEKLPYLKSLGVGVIYLNPIFEAYSNHKYDTGDYLKIDSMFGAEEDFKNLCKQANTLGMAIILDGVFNHTGSDSRYFNKEGKYDEIGAYQSKQSKYYSWYKFIDYPDNYESWWGVKTLPSVNQKDKDYLELITGKNGVIDKWITLGAKGFRLDVVDELEDHFIELIYQRIKKTNPSSIVIGEVWEDASHKISYGQRRKYFYGNQLDSVMNYPLKNAIFDYLKFNNLLGLKYQIRHLINNYPKNVLDSLMNVLGTHDTIRLLNNFATVSASKLSKDEQANYQMGKEEYQSAVISLKLATALQFTLPGVPSIYYGDEIGMQGFGDPFCRHPFTWDNINQDIYNWYKNLSDIRLYDVFIDGVYEEEEVHPNIFSFSRNNDAYKIQIYVNNNNYKITLSILRQGLDLINKTEVNKKMTIMPKEVRIIKFEKQTS